MIHLLFKKLKKRNMKKTILSLAIVTQGLWMTAQNTAKDVFSKDEIVWYGLDFSKSKMIGQFDQGAGAAQASGSDIKTKWIPSWNGVILAEPDKYDLKKTFRKTSVYKDLSIVEKNNASKIDPDNLLTYNDYKFKNPDAEVAEVVAGYGKGEKTEGIGLVFIIESFDKTQKQASVYVTFFDIASKKVLFKEHLTGKGGGIGLRNFWARSILEILKDIDEGVYKSWKKAFGG